MKRVFENGDSEYGIHEVYYDNNDKVKAWTENAIAPTGDDIKELKQTLERMALAAKKPILDYTNGKEIKPQKRRKQPKKTSKTTSRNKNV
jgi:hypothetical protein